MTKAETLNDRKYGIAGFRARHEKKREKIREENKKNGGALKRFWSDSWHGSAVLGHNGIVFLVWAMLMLATAYAALQIAFFVIAMVLAETGGIAMETPVDVITTYVVIGMCCGFCLFFAFAIEKWLIKHMTRRFWKFDRKTRTIDRGESWRERHEIAESLEASEDE